VWSIKSLVASDCSSKDQGMDVACALVGVDSFQICGVANDVILVHNTVTAKHVTCISGDLKCFSAVVSFDNTDHLGSQLVSVF